MAQRRTYSIHTTEDGKPYLFHTIASSETEAKKTFRKIHGRRRIKKIEVAIPASEVPTAPRPTRPTKRKKG